MATPQSIAKAAAKAQAQTITPRAEVTAERVEIPAEPPPAPKADPFTVGHEVYYKNWPLVRGKVTGRDQNDPTIVCFTYVDDSGVPHSKRAPESELGFG